jgi:hypothetical protein
MSKYLFYIISSRQICFSARFPGCKFLYRSLPGSFDTVVSGSRNRRQEGIPGIVVQEHWRKVIVEDIIQGPKCIIFKEYAHNWRIYDNCSNIQSYLQTRRVVPFTFRDKAIMEREKKNHRIGSMELSHGKDTVISTGPEIEHPIVRRWVSAIIRS